MCPLGNFTWPPPLPLLLGTEPWFTHLECANMQPMSQQPLLLLVLGSGSAVLEIFLWLGLLTWVVHMSTEWAYCPVTVAVVVSTALAFRKQAADQCPLQRDSSSGSGYGVHQHVLWAPKLQPLPLSRGSIFCSSGSLPKVGSTHIGCTKVSSRHQHLSHLSDAVPGKWAPPLALFLLSWVYSPGLYHLVF